MYEGNYVNFIKVKTTGENFEDGKPFDLPTVSFRLHMSSI